MKYAEVVRDLAARGPNWRFYNTQFISLRQTRAHGMPCGTTHFELRVRARVFRILLQRGQILHSLLGVPRSWVLLSQLVSAVHFIKGVKCTGLLQCTVIFVPQAEPPLQNQQRVYALPT
jgi:hypothetical protein